MAIAIPLIGGVREAANNVKCRSNLVQVHQAIFSYSKNNDEFILPDLVGKFDLSILINSGYLDADSKLGDCPGQDGKQNINDSSYVGGEKLDGSSSLLTLTNNDAILSDKDIHHSAGINTIYKDGSFSQTIPIRLTQAEQDQLNQDLIDAAKRDDATEVERLLKKGAEVNYKEPGDPPIGNQHWTALHWAAWKGHTGVIQVLLRRCGCKCPCNGKRLYCVRFDQ